MTDQEILKQLQNGYHLSPEELTRAQELTASLNIELRSRQSAKMPAPIVNPLTGNDARSLTEPLTKAARLIRDAQEEFSRSEFYNARNARDGHHRDQLRECRNQFNRQFSDLFNDLLELNKVINKQ